MPTTPAFQLTILFGAGCRVPSSQETASPRKGLVF